MPTSPLSVVIQHLLTDLRPDGDGLTDGELLARFLRSRDEDALADLVRRHARMVWGVCCRLLRNRHDTEDAFQATFLVLVRKAEDVPGQAVANWLYGVARQTAVRLRATAAKRRRRESQVVNMPEPTVAEVRDTDLQIVLDEELSRLPDHYRGVVVLCDLECMTRKEAARQLGIPEGSVASRLARARAMLAKRLKLRGVVISGGSAAVLSAGSASSAPPVLVASTIKAASLLAAGQAAGVSVEVAALTEGMVKAMFVTKIKSVLAVVLVLGFVATGATLLTSGTAAGQEVGLGYRKPAVLMEKPVEPKPKQQNDKEAFTAWGKEVGGLQAGLGYPPGQKRTYHPGETVTLVLRVRNVGKEEVKFASFREEFRESPPAVTDDEGQPVPLQTAIWSGWPKRIEVNLAPGKEVDLNEADLVLRPASEKGKETPVWKLYGTGKFQLQCDKAGGNIQDGKLGPDPLLSKLATGKLELEVKEADDKKPAADKPVEPAAKPQKEKVTAWGKEVDGVQVGIQFGEHRAYQVGETVTLTVRLRNNGKEDVPFRGDAEYFQKNPPLVTDADGKAIKIQARSIWGFILLRSLAPGKEVDLIQLELALRPVTDRKKDEAWTLYGTGKFHIEYQDVPVVGEPRLGAPVATHATGKLELEVKEADDKKPAIEKPEKKPTVDTVPPWTSMIPTPYEEPIKVVTKENPDEKPAVDKPVEPAVKQEERDLGKIEPPGGVPLSLVEPGTKKIGADQLNKVSKRLQSVPVNDLEPPVANDLERWIVEVERIVDMKMKDGPKQACRTYFAVHMSVAFDDLTWNTKSADKLYKRACTMPKKEATAWKEAFELLLKEEIGIKQAENEDEFSNLAGGPPWSVPLVLIPVDALHEGEKYSVERGKKYLARLKQLTKDDISLWSDKADKFGGTELDATLNIILLDEFFSKEGFQRDKFKAAVERQQEKK